MNPTAVELTTIVAVYVGGCAVLLAAGLRSRLLPGVGFVAGTALLVTVGAVQVVAHLPTAPMLTVALTGGLPVALLLVRLGWDRTTLRAAFPALLGAPVVIGAAALLREMHLVKWSPDSFQYLVTGSLLANNDYRDLVTPSLLTKRLLGASLLHAPANIGGEYYLRSILPLLAAAGAMTLVWIFRQGTWRSLSTVPGIAVAMLGALLLITINRYLFHAFYLNGHLLFAVLLLVVAGCGWLLISRGTVPPLTLVLLNLLAIPGLVVTRPEGALMAAIALLPTVLSDRVPLRHRFVILATLAVAVTGWHGFVLLMHHRQGAEITTSVSGMAAFGVLLLLCVPALRMSRLPRYRTHVLAMVEIGLWLALLAATLNASGILSTSLRATVQNVVLGAGSWGPSLMLLAGLTLVAVVMFGAPHEASLRFPVTTFVPLAFLLAYLREGAYRAGDGDSLNRMIIHIVPLAVLYIILALAAGERRWRRRTGTEHQASDPRQKPAVEVLATRHPADA